MNNEFCASSGAYIEVQTTGVLPFGRQPRESARAFAAFKAYLDLGPERRLVLAAESVGKSKRMMEKWSRKFDWQVRVQAHTAHVAEVERKAIERLASNERDSEAAGRRTTPYCA
jgi:hypothetical protein